jgi:hypothetical protein
MSLSLAWLAQRNHGASALFIPRGFIPSSEKERLTSAHAANRDKVCAIVVEL